MQFFEVKSIGGKGKGLAAQFNITKGTRIVHEELMFTTGNLSPISLLESKLKLLSKGEQCQSLSLYNNFPGKLPFNSITKTNALPLGLGFVIDGIFSTICRINHSCPLNSHHGWNEAAQCEKIQALRYIKAEEEITISYDRGGLRLPSYLSQRIIQLLLQLHCLFLTSRTSNQGAAEANIARALLRCLPDYHCPW